MASILSAKLEELCALADTSVSNTIGALSAECCNQLESRVQALFDKAFTDIVDAIASLVATAVASHHSRYDELVSHVRATAASIMEIASAPPVATTPIIETRRPYWSVRIEIDSLASLTMDGLSRFMPGPMRARRLARKRREALARALTKNLTSLHWNAKQSIDDTFRRLLTQTASSVEVSLVSTNEDLDCHPQASSR